MGVKRFLVAGGMASLVLIGVVLIFDAKSIAKPPPSPDEARERGMEFYDENVGIYPDNPPSPQDESGNPPSSQEGPGNPPPPQEEVASMGMGNMGDQQATSGDAQGAGGAGGGGGTGGGGGATVTITDLPETGGLSVVLLLTSALLLGSGLLMVVLVRSVRS